MLKVHETNGAQRRRGRCPTAKDPICAAGGGDATARRSGHQKAFAAVPVYYVKPDRKKHGRDRDKGAVL